MRLQYLVSKPQPSVCDYSKSGYYLSDSLEQAFSGQREVSLTLQVYPSVIRIILLLGERW